MEALKLSVVLDTVDKFTQPIKQALGEASAMSDTVRELKQQIASLDRTQQGLDGYRKYNAQLEKTALRKEQISKQLVKVEKELRSAAQPTKALLNQQKKLEKQYISVASQYDQQISKLHKMQIELEDAGVDVSDLSKAEARLSQQIDQANQSLNKHSSSADTAMRKVRQLNEVQRNLDSYTRLKNKVDVTSISLKQQSTEVERLRREFKQTSNPTQKLTKDLHQAEIRLESLTLEEKQQRGELDRLQRKLKETGYSALSLSDSQRKLTAATRQANQALEQQTRHMKQVQQAQKQLSRMKMQRDRAVQFASNMTVSGAGAMYAGQRSASALSKPVTVAMDFEEQMSKVQALTRLDVKGSPQDAAKFKALRDQALQLGASTQFSASESAGAQSFLAMSGFSPDKIIQAMPGMLDLAKAGGADLAATADISSNILSGFRLEADQMGRVGDVLTATFTRSNVDLSMLGESMKYAAPVATELNVSLEETAAMAGLLGNVGIQASMAGTSMRAIFNRMSSPPKAAAEALESIAVQTTDSVGNMRSMPEVLAEIAKKTESMGNAQRMAIFKAVAGEEAGSAMATLVAQQGAEGITQFVDVLKNAEGEAARVAAVMGDNTKGRIKAASSAWEGLMITVGKRLAPVIDDIVLKATAIIGKIDTWVQANPELAETILKVSLAVAGVVAGLGALGLALGAALAPLAILRYGFGMLGLKAASASGGVGLLSGVLGKILPILKPIMHIIKWTPIGRMITLFVAGAALILRHWEPIKAFFVGLGQGFYEGISPVITAIKQVGEALAPVFNVLKMALTPIVTTIGKILSGGLIAWFAELIGITKPSAESVQNWGQAVGKALAFVLTFPIKIITGFVGAFTAVKDSIGEMVAQVRQSPLKIIEIFATLPIKLARLGLDAISGFIKGMFDVDVVAAAKRITDKVTGSVKDFLGIKSPSRVFAQIGQDTVAGLEVGLVKQQPQVFSAMQHIATQLPEPINDAIYTTSNTLTNIPRPVPVAKTVPVMTSAQTTTRAGDVVLNQNITIHATPEQSVDDIRTMLDEYTRDLQRRAERRGRGVLFEEVA